MLEFWRVPNGPGSASGWRRDKTWRSEKNQYSTQVGKTLETVETRLTQMELPSSRLSGTFRGAENLCHDMPRILTSDE
jgi:hypothetical protein